jgi:hypothetical protein
MARTVTRPETSFVRDTGYRHSRARPSPIKKRTGLLKQEAERLLDWLEAHGCRGQVTIDDRDFTVQFSPRPGR